MKCYGKTNRGRRLVYNSVGSNKYNLKCTPLTHKLRLSALLIG